jgi:glycosyltransferase involved in cell wall biosynthesis
MKIQPSYPSDLPPYGSISKWFRHVVRMSVFVYFTRGFFALIKRCFFYIKENANIVLLIFFKPGAKVLFISGCPGGSRYYRCKNQSEMLASHNISSETYGQYSMNLLYLVDKFDIFVFQRTIYNSYTKRLMELIKNRNKKIIYETDDLVFDPAYLPYMDYYNFMDAMEKSWYENGIGREILENKYVKHCVVATDYLAQAIKKKYPDKKVFVSYNRLGSEQIVLARETLAKRNQLKINDGKIRIGYFSGSKSHNKDFNTITDVMIKILRENANAILMVVGHLDLDEKFSQVATQIERIAFVSVQKLPELILRADINIAPLEINNPFCQAKSALKFFETGLLEIPTVASATPDFRRCIRNGENGFVAENNADWEDFLTRLVQNKNLREEIGRQAKKDALKNHNAANKQEIEEFVEFIRSDLKNHSLAIRMEKLPKISIITVILNGETSLEACILSVAQQTYPNKEHIFMDGLSTDNSLQIIRNFAEKYPHIRWFSEKDEGIYDAMNRGIDMAAGGWVYFLGSDDVLYDSNVLESIFGNETEHQTDVICGNVKLKQSEVIFRNNPSLSQILERGIHHQAIFCKKRLFAKHGRFEIKYRRFADWAFNMRWFNDKDVKKIYLDQTIAVYNETGFSSQGRDKDFENEKEMLIKKHFSPIIFLFYKSGLSMALDIAQKGIRVLRERGIWSFVENICKYVIYGRKYFKNGINCPTSKLDV